MQYVFGPVPSRRLGYSLGIDVIPRKTCTLDCVYCQLGRTGNLTLERKAWVPADSVVEEVCGAAARYKGIDFMTFSGSGEPTLHAELGTMIARIKETCPQPVAVITNGTLLYDTHVREALSRADLVIPSMDAVSPRIFQRINRPHPSLRVDQIIEGMRVFSKEFRGALWVEVMVAQSINDTAEELERIAKVLETMRIDRVQINTVTRPPADEQIRPADDEVLQLARDIFGDKAEIIGSFAREEIIFEEADIRHRIVDLVGRHPDSAEQIGRALGIESARVEEHLDRLVRDGVLTAVAHQGVRYYRPVTER